jgi:hypothetical protein
MPRTKVTKERKPRATKLGAVKSSITKEKEEKRVFAFRVSIVSSGESYEADGDNLYQLLRAFPMPALVNTETNIVVTKNGKTIQRDLRVADARRCFTGFDTTSLELLAISINKQLP